MKKLFLLSLAAFLLTTANPARADLEEDIAWINKCIKDNETEGQTYEVVRKYCICMTDLMPESEEASVTEWEKTHPKEEKYCDKKAGWKR